MRKGKLYEKIHAGIPLRFENYVDSILEEFYNEIPKALIYGTPEQLEGGYDHDDVWIMMDLIKEWFSQSVPAKHR